MSFIFDISEIDPQALPEGIIEIDRNFRFVEPFFTKESKQAILFKDPDQTSMGIMLQEKVGNPGTPSAVEEILSDRFGVFLADQDQVLWRQLLKIF
jgi:hypothetical protein